LVIRYKIKSLGGSLKIVRLKNGSQIMKYGRITYTVIFLAQDLKRKMPIPLINNKGGKNLINISGRDQPPKETYIVDNPPNKINKVPRRILIPSIVAEVIFFISSIIPLPWQDGKGI
jgi:hypothetical protein